MHDRMVNTQERKEVHIWIFWISYSIVESWNSVDNDTMAVYL
jgi:hypothetical protein